MRIVLAPDSFKDCLSATRVCASLAEGVLRADPAADVVRVPMADGGQGTTEAILDAVGGERKYMRVSGPLGSPVETAYALVDGGRTAIIEMAAASGLELVPPDQRDPRRTTTFGTGELLRAALDADVDRVIVGIGGSATNDGGAGMAEALGYRLWNDNGESIPRGGGFLRELARIDSSHRHPRLGKIPIDVACDVTNPLTGPNGASAIYGPQKGATPDVVAELDGNLQHLASIIRRDLGIDVENLPGGGAAGGLGAGLVAFAKAELRRGVELVIDVVRLQDKLEGADLCLTGEGRMDSQSAFGKTAVGVARLCRSMSVPVVAIVGAIEGDVSALYSEGLTACFSIARRPQSLTEAIAECEDALARQAENIVRLFQSGWKGQPSQPASGPVP